MFASSPANGPVDSWPTNGFLPPTGGLGRHSGSGISGKPKKNIPKEVMAMGHTPRPPPPGVLEGSRTPLQTHTPLGPAPQPPTQSNSAGITPPDQGEQYNSTGVRGPPQIWDIKPPKKTQLREGGPPGGGSGCSPPAPLIYYPTRPPPGKFHNLPFEREKMGD